MCINRYNSARLGPMLAAMLLLGMWPTASSAQTLQIRNESPTPLVVQIAAVVRGALIRERPALLNQGDVSNPTMLSGNKVLTVYDGKAPNRVLFQGVIPASTQNQYFGIVPDRVPPRMRIEPRTAFRAR